MNYKFKIFNFIFAILPTVIITIIAVWMFSLIYSITFRYPTQEHVSFIEFCLGAIFLLLPLLFIPISIPGYILAYQYWKFSQKEVKIDFEYIEIKKIKSSEITVFKKSDIQKIVSISPLIKNHRLFSMFSYLVIFSKDSREVIPCFLVNKKDFMLHFGPFDNLAEGFPFTPFIKEKLYSKVERPLKFNLSDLDDIPIQISGRYLNLLRSLLIPGLALCLYAAYQMNLIWFLTLSILTLLIYFILLTQKKILITRTELIVKYLGNIKTYPLSSIKDIMEIKYAGMPSYYFSDPIIRLIITDNNGFKKTYFFFPRDNAFQELKKILHLD